LANITIPPGATELNTERDVIWTLARLISEELYIDTWMLKIDNERSGRGVAFIEIYHLKIIKEFRKKYE